MVICIAVLAFAIVMTVFCTPLDNSEFGVSRCKCGRLKNEHH